MQRALDHYVGRKVKRIHKPKKKDGIPQHEWTIELEGGATIKNYDENAEDPPNGIQGKSLQTVILLPDQTIAKFGQIQMTGPDDYEPFNVTDVELTPSKYSISDQGTEEFPQTISEEERAAINLSLVPEDPSPERAAPAPLIAPEADDA